MVLGWRRAFCSSIRRDRESSLAKEKEEQSNSNSSPSICSKFGFFSNPSTPRLQSQSVSSPGLRCRTTETEEAIVPANSVPQSPKQLRCKTIDNPKSFHHSNPSSPRSPSTFSLLKSSLRLSKSRCGICLQTVKAGQGMAIFTAECSHKFHFPCIAAHMKKQCNLLCPVCNFQWNEMPLLSINHKEEPVITAKQSKLAAKIEVKSRKERDQHSLKVYNDDEPLMSPTNGVRFNPIPESDEENENGVEFQGLFMNTSSIVESRNVEVTLLPEAAVVSVRRSSQAQVIVLKVRAPAAKTKSTHRAPIDVVTVVDVSGNITTEKLQMMKRTMKLIISHLSSADRLSIVAFSSSSKRLLPLRKMTANGRRSVRRMVDAMVALDGKSSANDAMKKATKVLEDRRDRNSAASIILLSDVHDEQSSLFNQSRKNPFVSSTRHPDLDIPVHSIHFTQLGACRHAHNDDAFGKCVRSLLSIVVQDLRFELGLDSGSAPAEIAAIYSDNGPAEPLDSGSVSIGDLFGGEERELLVELKIPSSAIGAHHVLSFTCYYTDPSSQQSICRKDQALAVPQPQAVRSTTHGIQRLRNLFVATRAIAESRRLTERNDLNGAHHMLSSARALLLKSGSSSANEFIHGLEAELSEVQRKRDNLIQRNRGQVAEKLAFLDEKGEPLTPTSAWRAAECLAKVAIMRKSLNRVSDLHGFEDARF